MSDGQHSVLAPSASPMWARCVGSLFLGKGVPEVDKEYNASGTCSHWILEQSLKNGINPDVFLGKKMTFNGFEFVIDEERLDRVRSVMVNIYREPGQMWIEHKINMTPVYGPPGQIGHADIMKVDPSGTVVINDVPYTGVLSIHDFKDGYLRVMARDNLQGLGYLAGALYEVDLSVEINALRFCIHQPKIGHYDEWSYTRKEIETFIAAIRPAAQMAYDLYYGTVLFDPKLHLTAGEEQCFWCPVRGRCPARAQRILEGFKDIISVHELDDAHLGRLYARLDEIEQACRDYREEALRRARMGRTIEGQKLVYGKQGKRTWIDPVKGEAVMGLLLAEDQMYEPRTIISPTQAQKLLKKDYEKVKPYITQSNANLTLAPADDPRDAVELPKFEIRKPQESLL